MIKAEVHSDDRVFEINFDATDWAKEASKEEIEDLRNCDYCRDYGADAVALYYEDTHKEIGAMFDYISNIRHTRKACGFECEVDEDSFEQWINQNRPELRIKV